MSPATLPLIQDKSTLKIKDPSPNLVPSQPKSQNKSKTRRLRGLELVNLDEKARIRDKALISKAKTSINKSDLKK